MIDDRDLRQDPGKFEAGFFLHLLIRKSGRVSAQKLCLAGPVQWHRAAYFDCSSMG